MKKVTRKNIDIPNSSMKELKKEFALSEFGTIKPFLESILIDHADKNKSKLPRSENVYQTIIESLTHVIWVADKDGEVNYLNEAWTNWTGRSVDESMGHHWTYALHPEDLQPQIAQWKDAYNNGKRYYGECRFMHISGKITDCAYIGIPVKDEQGKITNWIGINVDITERIKAELEMKNKVRELTKLNRILVRKDKELAEYKKLLKNVTGSN